MARDGVAIAGEHVARALSTISQKRLLLHSITVDHGTKFTSKVLDQRAWKRGIQLDFTRLGKPTDNGLCESFNGRLRDEFFECACVESIDHARQVIEGWRKDYDEHRPHSALGHLTPSEYAKAVSTTS